MGRFANPVHGQASEAASAIFRDLDVSVVIPTFRRANVLWRAVNSVLGQTLQPRELIVVSDGPGDEQTASLIAASRVDLVRHFETGQHLGAASTRNYGVRQARGQLIAFLDDDDEWLPQKLERQVLAIASSGPQWHVSFHPVIARSAAGDSVWGRRRPVVGEHVSDYMFVRRGAAGAEGAIGTSTLVCSRDLLLQVPFDPELSRFQDADFVLRAWAAGASFSFVDEPLSIWHAGSPDSITTRHSGEWQTAMRWIRHRRELVTPRAYAAFLLTTVTDRAARAHTPTASVPIVLEAFRGGRPRLQDVLVFCSKWLLPRWLRRRISIWLA